MKILVTSSFGFKSRTNSDLVKMSNYIRDVLDKVDTVKDTNSVSIYLTTLYQAARNLDNSMRTDF